MNATRGSVGRRWSIVTRLLIAFLVVSVVPIALLAILSLQERESVGESVAGSQPSGHVEGSGETGTETGAEGGNEGGTAPSQGSGGDSLGGVPIATIELGIAAASLGLSALMAVYIARTIVRPIRSLEASMARTEAGDLEATAPVESSDEIGHLAAAFNRMMVGLRREALIRDLFGQYVTPELAQLAIEREGHLEGQEVECSILFADIRGFTSLAEVLPAHRLMQTLNSYLACMLQEVAAEGGIVNKFGGDSILAIFGSPLNPAPDHAARAVRAAIRMRDALASFNRSQMAEHLPEIHVGFGVATGPVVAGNLGSERKIEYTVIGDPVNLAARLQELSRDIGQPILVADATAQRARNVARLEPIGHRTIRGRVEPVDVYAAQELLVPIDASTTLLPPVH